MGTWFYVLEVEINKVHDSIVSRYCTLPTLNVYGHERGDGAGQKKSSVCVALSLAVEQHVSQQRHLSGGHEERAARRSRHGQRAGSV